MIDRKKLKKSYITEGINLYLVRIILRFFKGRFIPNGKILIKSCDGIGDILVRSKLMKLLQEKYGEDNVYVMMQKNYTYLGEMLGYKVISYSRKDRKNIFYRLKKMYQINSLGFSEYINLEFGNDITVGNLFIPKKIGKEDLNWQVSRNNKYYTETYRLKNEYIMNQISDMTKFLLEKEFSSEELYPDIRDLFSIKEECIAISIGASGRGRVCAPALMAEYIQEIIKKYPEKEIILLGNGPVQAKYAQKVKELVDSKNISNLVDKTSIKEAFEMIAKSYLFVGFDSGMYNFVFSIKKKGIGLFRNTTGAFLHREPWLKVLTPEKIRNDILDSEYSNLEINSITVEQFSEALKEIENEKLSC